MMHGTVENLMAKGVQFHQGGNLAEAEKIYEAILSVNPANAQALYLMGMASRQRGDLPVAETWFERAAKAAPDVPDFHYMHGLCRHEQGRAEEAIRHYRKALAAKPDYVEAEVNLGVACLDLSRLDKAVTCFKKVLLKQPRHVNALNNLGNAYQAQFNLPEAIHCYRQVLQLAPQSVDVWDNLGIAYCRSGQWAEAQECFEQAIVLNGEYAPAFRNLGRVCEEQKAHGKALKCYQAALELDPESPETFNALANLLYQLGEFEAAREAYQTACALRPNRIAWQLRANTLCPIIAENIAQTQAVRSRIAGSLDALAGVSLDLSAGELAESNCEPSFYLPYHGLDDRPIKSAYGDLLAANLPPLDVPPIKSRVNAARPKVGFLVTPRHEDIFSKLFGSTAALLSPGKLDVRIICTADSVEKIRTAVPEGEALRFFVVPNHLEKALAEIRGEGFDIAFPFEVGTDSLNYFLPLYRMAPVQCTTWGFPVTSGLPTMDYFLSSSRFETPEHQRHYREKLVLLPGMLSYFHRPELPEMPFGRADFGIAPKTHVYGCLQSIFKFHPGMDRIFAEILRRDPQGELFLLDGQVPQWTELYMARLQQAMSPDCFARVRLLPRMSREKFLSFQALSDVLLDPLHYGGGTTTMEGLAFGTPVVTLPSEFLRARLTYGFYQRMDMSDCVADTPQAYIDLALRYGSDPQARHAVKDKILSRCHVLFEDQQAVTDLTDFFLQAAAEAATGHP